LRIIGIRKMWVENKDLSYEHFLETLGKDEPYNGFELNWNTFLI